MGLEIERKFLVTSDAYRQYRKELLMQGYLSRDKDRTIRVRLTSDAGYLTIKGASDKAGIARAEYEYIIPMSEAKEMLESMCEKPLIEKYRYEVPLGNHLWEVDEFLGENEGLVVAEIELDDENEAFEKPEWIGEEVTGDKRYYNAMLSVKPYREWE